MFCLPLVSDLLRMFTLTAMQQKLAKKDGAKFDRSQDIARLREFYKAYRERHRVDELQEEERKWRESGSISGDLGEYVLQSQTFKSRN